MEIAEKLRDALSMFWESLDAQERRLIMLAAAWLVVAGVSVPLEAARRKREREEIVQAVMERLSRG